MEAIATISENAIALRARFLRRYLLEFQDHGRQWSTIIDARFHTIVSTVGEQQRGFRHERVPRKKDIYG